MLSKLSRVYLALKKLLAKTDVVVLNDLSGSETARGVPLKAGERSFTILLDVDGEQLAVGIRITSFEFIPRASIGVKHPDSLPIGPAAEIWWR